MLPWPREGCTISTRSRNEDGTPPRTPRRIQAIALGIAALFVIVLLALRGPFRSKTPEVDHPSDYTPHRVTLTIAPLVSPQVLPDDLRPILRYLERALPIEIVAKRTSTHAAAIEAVTHSSADLALLSALGCVQAVELEENIQFVATHATDGEWTSPVSLVVRRGDGPREIEELRGRRVCASDRSSTAGHLLLRTALRHQGRTPAVFFSGIRWSGNHERALEDLERGRCDAAAVPHRKISHSETPRAFREVMKLGVVPLHCWIASPEFDDRLSQSIADALVTFDPLTETDRSYVGESLRITGFRPADRSTYHAVHIAARLEGLLRPAGMPHN